MTRSDPRPFAGRSLLAVFAHPDDEALACGGTLARCAAEGAQVRLLCATEGGAGQGQPEKGRTLSEIRRQELHEAAARLGVTEVVLLDHEDGDLRSVAPTVLRGEILVVIRHYRPDVVITFGEDGLYWHPDHLVIHEQVTDAVARLDRRPPALWYVTLLAGMMSRALEAARTHPGAPRDLGFWGIDPSAFGARAQPPTLELDVRAHAPQKLAALRCHRTQIDERSPFAWLTDAEAADLLGTEHFHRAAVGDQQTSFLESLESLIANR